MPSRVFEFAKQGALLRSWTVRGQDSERGPRRPGRDQRRARAPGAARQGARPGAAAQPPQGQAARVRQLSRRGDPELRGLGTGAASSTSPTTPTAVLWRIPPGGGMAEPWLEDPRLEGEGFGSTGLELSADRRHLLLATQSSAGGGDGNPATGKLYEIDDRLRRRARGDPDPLGEPAAGRARRVRDRREWADLHVAAARQPDRRDRARRRGGRALSGGLARARTAPRSPSTTPRAPPSSAAG